MKKKSLNIWIDIANSPHVLFFEPIINELKKLGHSVYLTVRDFCNTVSLAEAKGFEFKQIGAGFEYARIEVIKRMYLHFRRVKLTRYAQSKNFDVAVSHGSSSQAMAAKKLGIPVFSTQDYEYNNFKAFGKVECFMIPDIVPADLYESSGVAGKSIRKYSGLKENVYLYNYNFKLNDIIDKFNINPDEIILTFRPVSDTAHYLEYSNHDFQNFLIEKISNQGNVKIIVLPRTEFQKKRFESKAVRFPNIKVCSGVVDGPSLIALSDLVVSGGGTMIREAAVLGVPAVSFFHGRPGAVDQWLEKEGRLQIIKDEGDLKKILPLKKRLKQILKPGNGTISSIVHGICNTAVK
jgi:predicted glycosyltransferase